MLLDVCQLTRGVTDDQSFMLANSLQDQHNFSRHTNSIIVWIFIQNISKFLTRLPPRRPFSKLWSISRHDTVSEYKHIFCLADTPQRVENIRRAIYVLHILAFLSFSCSKKFSYFSYIFLFTIAKRAIAQAASFPIKCTIQSMVCYPHLPNNYGELQLIIKK